VGGDAAQNELMEQITFRPARESEQDIIGKPPHGPRSRSPGVLPWASADWADANPGKNIIQSAETRHGSIGRTVHRRTSFAVRLNQTAIRDVVICSLSATYTSTSPETALSGGDAAHAWPVSS
jgi:hypothetical protein